MKKLRYILLIVIPMGFLITFMNGCKLPEWEERTNYEILIGEYFEQHPDSFSIFLDVLKKSETLSFLKAYGTYTCFAPTNEAFNSYFSEKGIASVDAMDPAQLKDLVRFCVIKDTIRSEEFVDGRMRTPSLQGQYLTYGTFFEEGRLIRRINKVAELEQIDIKTSNGIIHTLKKVIEPEVKTIAQYIESLGSYSIYTKALKETGYYDTLNVLPTAQTDTLWYTIFAVSDAVFKNDGINNFEEMKARYQTDEFPNGLHLFMAYHILRDQYRFVTDLVSAKTVPTMAPSEVLTVRSTSGNVLINDDYFAGVHEPGFQISRAESDQLAGNGVIHFMEGNFAIKTRYPFPVYWDVCEQIEIQKMPGVFRKTSAYGLVNGQLEGISWEPESATIDYLVGEAYGYHVFNDYLQVYFRPEVVKSITFKTPTLVKGFYNIWVCTRNVPTSARMYKAYVYFNDEQTTRIIDGAKSPGMSNGVAPTDGQLNMDGFRIYQYKPSDYFTTDPATIETNILAGKNNNWLGGSAWGRWASQLAGTVEVKETGEQTIKFVATAGGNGSNLWLDMILFIPVNEDQNWPRINVKDGSFVYKEDLEAGIFPN